MRRRHRIQSIYMNRNERNVGFGLVTREGSVFFPLNSRDPKRRLRHFLPHIVDELLCSNFYSLKELENLLLGRYVYGISTEIFRNEMISKILT